MDKSLLVGDPGFVKRMNEAHIEKVRRELEPLTFDERVSYLTEMHKVQLSATRAFSPGDKDIVWSYIRTLSAGEVVKKCKESEASFEALRQIVRLDLKGHSAPNSQDLGDLHKELLLDFLSPSPGPNAKQGAPSNLARRKAAFRMYELLKDTRLYHRRLGTNRASDPNNVKKTAVYTVAQVFEESEKTVREWCTRKKLRSEAA